MSKMCSSMSRCVTARNVRFPVVMEVNEVVACWRCAKHKMCDGDLDAFGSGEIGEIEEWSRTSARWRLFALES